MREDMRNILEVNFRVSLLPGGGDQRYLVSSIKLEEEGGGRGGRCWIESKPELGDWDIVGQTNTTAGSR